MENEQVLSEVYLLIKDELVEYDDFVKMYELINQMSKINPNPDKPEKFLQFLHVSSTIKKNAGGCVHVTYG